MDNLLISSEESDEETGSISGNSSGTNLRIHIPEVKMKII